MPVFCFVGKHACENLVKKKKAIGLGRKIGDMIMGIYYASNCFLIINA